MKYTESSYIYNGITVINTWIPTKEITKYQPITQVYGVVFDKNGNILVCREKPDAPWQIPGGTPEKDESLEETLIRELNEEVNITVSNILPLGVQKVSIPDNPNKEIKDVFYQARFNALLDKLNVQSKDPATGSIWERKLIPSAEINDYIKWGESGGVMFEDAISIFKSTLKLK